MESLFIYLFFGWALTSLVVNGTIFSPMRNYLLVMAPFFGKLVSCIQCFGLWVGFFIFFPAVCYEEVFIPGSPMWVSLLIFPVIQSGFAVIMESIVIWLVKGSRIED
jgi:hypothetical protein